MIGNYQELFKLINAIGSDTPIYISGHDRPDYDSIGSGLALTRFLNELGKESYFLLNKNDYSNLDWFDDLRYITPVVNHDNYVFIQVDASRKARLGEFETYFDKAMFTINIDHHENHLMEAKYNFCIKDSSSTAEIIYNLISMFNRPLNKPTAELLFAGIITDTYCYSNRTSKETLMICSKLLQCGIDNERLIKTVYLDKTKEDIAILIDMLKRIKHDGFHYIVMNRNEELYQEAEFNTIFRKSIPVVQNIKGIELICLFLIKNNTIYGNIRSNTALEIGSLIGALGGGGHKKSGNFVNNNSLVDNIKIIQDYITSGGKL